MRMVPMSRGPMEQSDIERTLQHRLGMPRYARRTQPDCRTAYAVAVPG